MNKLNRNQSVASTSSFKYLKILWMKKDQLTNYRNQKAKE